MARKKPAAAPEEPAAEHLDQVEFEPSPSDEILAAVNGDVAFGDQEAAEEMPNLTDPGWSEYVLRQLTEDELVERDGQTAPTTDGLRRVAPKLLGDILQSTAHLVVAPSPENNFLAVVEHRVRFLWTLHVDVAQEREFGDVASVHPQNTDAKYLRYAVETAATRAEGRALRKALGLRRVVAAEELTELPVELMGPSGKINRSQVNFLDMICSRVDVNVVSYIAEWPGKYAKIDDVPFDVAVQMQGHLSELQRDPQRIPGHVKGYNANWRKVKE